MKSKLAFISVLVLLGLTSIVPVVSAADPMFIPLVGIPGVDPNDPVLGTYINAIYRLSISLAALLAVIKIVAAGASYMLSDIVTNKSKAKDDIRGALIGLLIVISAVLILTTVNSDLTKTDLLVTPVVLQPPPLPPLPPPTPYGVPVPVTSLSDAELDSFRANCIGTIANSNITVVTDDGAGGLIGVPTEMIGCYRDSTLINAEIGDVLYKSEYIPAEYEAARALFESTCTTNEGVYNYNWFIRDSCNAEEILDVIEVGEVFSFSNEVEPYTTAGVVDTTIDTFEIQCSSISGGRMQIDYPSSTEIKLTCNPSYASVSEDFKRTCEEIGVGGYGTYTNPVFGNDYCTYPDNTVVYLDDPYDPFD